jgi:predicted transcriptional regulator
MNILIELFVTFLKMSRSMKEDIDRIIYEINESGYLATHKDWEGSLQALLRLEAENIIQNKGRNDYYLTKNGYKVIELGGYEKWLEFLNKQEKKSSISIVGDNAVIGNNNSNLNQGHKLGLLDSKKPVENLKEKDVTEIKMSKAQFIFWLFTAFTSGIGVSYMIFNILKNE